MENMIRDYLEKQMIDAYMIKKIMLENSDIMDVLQKSCEIIINAYKNGKKTLIAGNGGSAADAQHIAGEFVSRFYFDRPGLPSIALTTDSSVLTAIGNDYGYENVFSRQLESNGNEGDVFIGISTSGNSPNILAALSIAKQKNIFSIGFTGESGGKMKDLCNLCLCIPSKITPRIQESHILIGHLICASVEEAIFGSRFNEIKKPL